MLDLKRIRNDFEQVKEALAKRGEDYCLEVILDLDEGRRGILGEVEQLKNKQNTVSKEIPKLKKAGQDVSGVMEEMKELSQRIKELDGELKGVEEELQSKLLSIPNTPHPDVPVGD